MNEEIDARFNLVESRLTKLEGTPAETAPAAPPAPATQEQLEDTPPEAPAEENTEE